MIEEFNYFLLGLVQGLAEFFPISSSGHILILSTILDVAKKNPLLLSITVHFATTLSTIVIYNNKLKNILIGVIKHKDYVAISYLLKILISSIPVLIVGLFFKDYVESLFNNSMLLVLIMLFITGCVLISTTVASIGDKRISYYYAFLIGLAQAIAILPGISRSGATISTAVLLGIEKTKAAKFSFLMVIPLIFGKIIKDIFSGQLTFESHQFPILITGFTAAFLSGLFACTCMMHIVKNSKLKYFAIYCSLVGLFSVIYSLTK